MGHGGVCREAVLSQELQAWSSKPLITEISC